jgi:hypothetical protein
VKLLFLDEQISPRLWCGFNDGRIKVFNAVTWTLESEIIVDHKSNVVSFDFYH